MDRIILKSKLRKETGKKVKKYRQDGLVPAVVYGKKIPSRNLWVDLLEMEKVYSRAGENTIIELDVKGGKKVNVLIHDIQVNPLSENFSHVDFFQIRMDEKIETEIPLEFTGEAPAVKELGGVLVKNMDDVPVSCLPADLPSMLEVNIEKLKTFDDRFKVSELSVSEKVKILLDSETIIALVSPPRSEEEMAKLDEKIEEDVTKVEGVEEEVKEGEEAKEKETEEKKSEEEKPAEEKKEDKPVTGNQ